MNSKVRMKEITMVNIEIVQSLEDDGVMANTASRKKPAATPVASMGWADSARIKFHAFWLHRTDLWGHIRRFGSWLEFEAAPIASDRSESEIILELDTESTLRSLRIGPRPHEQELDGYAQLWSFLWSLGIRTIHLDARLERNQIEDVIGLLYCHHAAIQTRRPAASRVLAQLMSPQGIHIACTETSLCDCTLKVTYTYCTLQFSRIVHWFEARNRKFHDHRTLFHAAQRYAAAFALAVTGPAMVLSAILGHLVLCTVIGSSAIVLFALTYMSFMIVGSVEYDNEEKAYRLSKAYGRLREYTSRIRADIERARTVQETFLPTADKMPFQDHIQWATGFMPAEEVGGDYFDVAELDHTRVAILFSDVSGHGMAAAFITAVMKTTFQAWLDAEGTLEELAQQMNVNLLRLVPLGNFAAAFIAIYDRSTSRLHYINCGHQPEPWHIPRDKDHTIHALNDARNLIMGIEEHVELTTSNVTLAPGDTVLFVSDGIVENPNIDGALYGTERFESFLQSKRVLPPETLVQMISEEARHYSRGTDQSDDRTILALRIRAQSSKQETRQANSSSA